MERAYKHFFNSLHMFCQQSGVSVYQMTLMQKNHVRQQKTLTDNEGPVLSFELDHEHTLEITCSRTLTCSETGSWKQFFTTQWLILSEYEHAYLKMQMKDLLLTTAKQLSSTLKIEDVLRHVLTQAMTLVEAADSCGVYFFDEETRTLIPKVAGGFKWEHIKNIRFQPGESLTGLTFVKREPMIFHHTEEVYKGMATMSEENRRHLNLSFPKDRNGQTATSKGALCCPILYKDKCVGVISLNNFFQPAHFKLGDMELLEAISKQAGLAFERSQLYQLAVQRSEELDTLNKNVQKKNAMLEYAFEAHRRLMNITLEQKGLEAISDTVSTILSRPVAIYDEFMNFMTSTPEPDEFDFSLEFPPFLENIKRAQVSLAL